MTKRQLLRERDFILNELAALQAENLKLRSGEAEMQILPASDDFLNEKPAAQAQFSRFPLLRAVDEEHENAVPGETPPAAASLIQIVEHLRKYAAAHFGIYADRALFAHFLGAMAACDFILLRSDDPHRSPLLLCQAAAAAWGQRLSLTTVQPHWSSAADLIGSAEPETKLYRETAFLRQLYTAGYEDGPCFTALDHVTAAPESYLAGLLPTLALSKCPARSIPLAEAHWPGDPLLLQDGALPYPDNLWLFGNIVSNEAQPGERLSGTAMEFCLPALRHRAYLVSLARPMPLSALELRAHFAHAYEVFALPDEALLRFGQAAQHLADHMDLSLGPTAETQLRRFGAVCLACGLRPAEALDGFFYHKALRRFGSLDAATLRYELPGLRRLFKETYGARGLPLAMGLLEDMEMKHE